MMSLRGDLLTLSHVSTSRGTWPSSRRWARSPPGRGYASSHFDHLALGERALVVIADNQELAADAADRAAVRRDVIRLQADGKHAVGGVRAGIDQRQMNGV